jgi:hypothetical protein
MTAVTDVACGCIFQLSRHSEGLQKKIENLEEVFTTSQAQDHGYASNLPPRPMTGSDWGLLGAAEDVAMPTHGSASMKPGRRRGGPVVDDAADALLRQAGTY